MISISFIIKILFVLIIAFSVYSSVAVTVTYFSIRKNFNANVRALLVGMLFWVPLKGTVYGFIGGVIAFLATRFLYPEKGASAQDLALILFSLFGFLGGAVGGIVAFWQKYRLLIQGPNDMQR